MSHRRPKINCSTAILAVILLFTSPAIFAQNIPNISQPTSPKVIQGQIPLEKGKTDRLASIRKLIAQGAYISAINILENIYQNEPDNRGVIELMLTCYLELKAFPKAEILLQRQIEKSPDDYYNHYLLLDTYLKMGNDSLAEIKANDILKRYPGNKEIQNSLIRALISYGGNQKAMKLIEDGRKEYKQNSLFALEAASIHESKSEFYEAVMEYFKAIQSDTMFIPDVDRRLSSLIRFPGAPPLVIKALRTILDTLPNNTFALKTLEEAYIKNNQFIEAFDICIHLDSLTGHQGNEIFQYLKQCRERKLYEQVIKTSEYIEKNYSSNWIHSQYRFYYAEALTEIGMVSDAISGYNLIIKNYPQARDKAEALLLLGNIYRYKLGNLDSAKMYYDSVANYYQFAPYTYSAPIEIAKLYLVKGKLDSSAGIFEKLRAAEPEAERKEFIDYHLGLILFFKYQYRDADLAFRKLMAEYPRGFYVNDALQNSLVISETAETSPEVLANYADAIYYEMREIPDSVEAKLKAIMAQGDTPLVGLTNYRLALHYVANSHIASALEIIEKMEKDHLDNHFYPYCLKLKGDIYFNSADRKNDAALIYKTILEKYNDYPFNGEVREKLQELEGYRLPG